MKKRAKIAFAIWLVIPKLQPFLYTFEQGADILIANESPSQNELRMVDDVNNDYLTIWVDKMYFE